MFKFSQDPNAERLEFLHLRYQALLNRAFDSGCFVREISLKRSISPIAGIEANEKGNLSLIDECKRIRAEIAAPESGRH